MSDTVTDTSIVPTENPVIANSAVLTEPQELVIQPRRGWIAIDWAELLRSRELLYFLIWRDYKVRYKQTVLGIAWAVIQPVFGLFDFLKTERRFADIA